MIRRGFGNVGQSGLIRTIRLDEDAIARIVEELASLEKTEPGFERRASQRFDYRMNNCIVYIPQARGKPIPYLVTCRNISAHGASFLHGGYVYEDTHVIVRMLNSRRTWREFKGRVVRCKYLQASIHEFAVKFDREIDASEFAPEAAKRRVLVVDDESLAIRLAGHLLEQLGVEFDIANSGAQAIEKTAAGAYDLVLTELALPDMDGCDLVRQLRDKGYRGMIAALTGLTQPADRERSIEAGCDWYLPKPYSRADLQVLLTELSKEPLVSSLQSDPTMAPLIDAFASEMPTRIRAIEEAAHTSNAETLEVLARKLKGEAGGYGFEPISEAAANLELALINKSPEDTLHPLVFQLVRRCHLVRAPSRNDRAQAPVEPAANDSTAPATKQ